MCGHKPKCIAGLTQVLHYTGFDKSSTLHLILLLSITSGYLPGNQETMKWHIGKALKQEKKRKMQSKNILHSLFSLLLVFRMMASLNRGQPPAWHTKAVHHRPECLKAGSTMEMGGP